MQLMRSFFALICLTLSVLIVYHNVIRKEKQNIECEDYMNVDILRKDLTPEQAKSEINNLRKRLASLFEVHQCYPKVDPDIPWVFAVTLTYSRHTQKADLVRLSQTLMHVPNLHWIIVEDSPKKTVLVSKLLEESCLKFTHLYSKAVPNHLIIFRTLVFIYECGNAYLVAGLYFGRN